MSNRSHVEEAIVSFCQRNELPISSTATDRLSHYLSLLDQFNRRMNLVGPMDADQMIHDLLIDSLTPAAVVSPSGRMLDVGTGAGLPSVPLHIVADGLSTTVVEPRKRRVQFLEIVRHRLGLERFSIQQKTIETFSDDPFDYVISKAFQPPLQWVETAHPWLSDGGKLVCMARPEDREPLERTARQWNLERVGCVEDVSSLGARTRELPRSIYVFGRRETQ